MHQSFLATWGLQHLVWSNVKFVQVHTATYDQVEASAFKRMCLALSQLPEEFGISPRPPLRSGCGLEKSKPNLEVVAVGDLAVAQGPPLMSFLARDSRKSRVAGHRSRLHKQVSTEQLLKDLNMDGVFAEEIEARLCQDVKAVVARSSGYFRQWD